MYLLGSLLGNACLSNPFSQIGLIKIGVVLFLGPELNSGLRLRGDDECRAVEVLYKGRKGEWRTCTSAFLSSPSPLSHHPTPL
jgi:hypothetical protein